MKLQNNEAVKYLSFDNQSSSKYSVNRVFSDHWHCSNATLCSRSSTITTPFQSWHRTMITWEEAIFIAVCLEGFFYGKISVLCALTCTLAKKPNYSWSRALFRNIRYVFTMLIEQVQDGNHSFLYCLSSLCSIHCYRCQ